MSTAREIRGSEAAFPGLEEDQFNRRVPSLQPSNEPIVVAVGCSDIQFSHRPPLARSTEPNWYTAMDRAMYQLRTLCKQYDCPLIAAGDLFEEWNCPPELLNFAAGAIPRPCFAIPGNHDLPHHNYSEIKRSAYWTLVEGNIIHDLSPGCPTYTPKKDLVMYGYPWRFAPKPIKYQYDESVQRLAVVHAYCWSSSKCYDGASQEDHWKHIIPNLGGHSFAIYGDNHKGFLVRSGSFYLLNCGGLIRRKIDEINYRPRVGLIWSNGVITQHFLDTTGDVFFDGRVEKIDLPTIGNLADEISKSVDNEIDFKEALEKEALNQPEGIKKAILGAIRNGQ